MAMTPQFRLVLILSLLLLSCLGFTRQAGAEQPHWYAGFGGGGTELESDVVPLVETLISMDERQIGYKVFGGYKFTDFIALELSYTDFGELEIFANSGSLMDSGGKRWTYSRDNVTVTAGVDAIALGVVLSLPMNRFTDWKIVRSLEPFFKIGGQYWDFDVTIPAGSVNQTASDGTDFDFFYGAGLIANLNRYFAIRMEYEHFNLKRVMIEDVELVSGSIMIRF